MFGQGKPGKGISSSSSSKRFPPRENYKSNNYSYNNNKYTTQFTPIELNQVENYKGKF